MHHAHRNSPARETGSAAVIATSAFWGVNSFAAPNSAAGNSFDQAVQSQVTAAFARFIGGQNAHDSSVVSEVLLDSPEFVWAQYGGNSVWGYDQAITSFGENWKGTWHLDPQLSELRISAVAPGVAVLITPLLFTEGDPGEQASTLPVRWGGVFVKTTVGWRISSIFITPFPRWHTK